MIFSEQVVHFVFYCSTYFLHNTLLEKICPHHFVQNRSKFKELYQYLPEQYFKFLLFINNKYFVSLLITLFALKMTILGP